MQINAQLAMLCLIIYGRINHFKTEENEKYIYNNSIPICCSNSIGTGGDRV